MKDATSSPALADALRLWGFEDDSIFRKYKLNLSPRPETMSAHFEALVGYGIKAEAVQRMARLVPGILAYRAERSLAAFSRIEAMGFQPAHVRKMVSMVPGVMGFTPERIERSIDNLVDFGFSREQALTMVRRVPGILCFKTTRVNDSLSCLVGRLPTREDARIVLRGCPGALCWTVERLGQALDVAVAIDFDPKRQPTNLMYAPKLLRGRYAVLVDRTVEPTYKLLYLCNKRFKERFGVTREQAVARDPGPELFRR